MSADLQRLVARVMGAVDGWEASWGTHPSHPSLQVPEERLDAALEQYFARLFAPADAADEAARGNYPFGHPRYAGQMLKPPHPVAVAAYFAALRINPNNHALDGGPPTSQMETEVVGDLSGLFGFPGEALGHLTSGGTVANLEALWLAREATGGTPIGFSGQAHYTHARMAGVLGVPTLGLATDGAGRLDLGALEEALKAERMGTVVLTAGTTGLGVVDPIHEAIPLCRRYGARVHVDAAYGGFFRLLTDVPEAEGGLGVDEAEAFRAIAGADTIVVDPHKHGLQPYGCGCILVRDPAEGRFYHHDSPYTYFTSDALHLGEISLECSRAGAAAGALWMTLKALPLTPDGLGAVLAACRRAALGFADGVDASERLRLYARPALDIVAYAPEPPEPTLSALDRASERVFDAGTASDDPVFVSLFRVEAASLKARWPDLEADRPHARILRSVLMKPEHEPYTPTLLARLDALAGQPPSA